MARLKASSVPKDPPFAPVWSSGSFGWPPVPPYSALALLTISTEICGASGDPLPALRPEALDRPEAGLVSHLAAAADPVAEVDVGQAVAHRLPQQPDDHVAAQAARRLLGVEEAV